MIENFIGGSRVLYFLFISSESEQEQESHGKKGLKACARSPDIRCIQLSHQSIEQFAFLVSLLPHLLTHSEAPKSVHSLSAEKHERLFYSIICPNGPSQLSLTDFSFHTGISSLHLQKDKGGEAKQSTRGQYWMRKGYFLQEAQTYL